MQISEISNKETDYAKNIDSVMPMYNLIEYSDNYLKTSGSLWQYYRDKPFINDGGVIDVPDDPDSASFKYNTGNDGKKIVQIMVPLKYLINFWRILEMPLINCEINIFLTWSEKYIIVNENNYGHQDPKFAILIQKFMLQL